MSDPNVDTKNCTKVLACTMFEVLYLFLTVTR